MNTPLDKYFRSLAEGYLDVIKKQGREFFGLRDFYRYVTVVGSSVYPGEYWKLYVGCVC